jgi:hypothetical protein
VADRTPDTDFCGADSADLPYRRTCLRFDAAAFHIWRGVIFSEARAEGALYPRWVMPINGGLGGPLFNFYSPLSYYLMDALHALGLPHTLAWRVLVALALIIGSLGMFALGLYLFKRADCALLATACFTYAPYYLRDFFERGAPQGMAIALYPLLLLALLRLAENPTGWRIALAVVTWCAVLLMHNLSGLIVLPVIGVVVLYCMFRFRWQLLLPLATTLIIGVLLAACHILPFVLDAKYIQINAASQDPAVQPALNPVAAGDLFAPPTVYDTGLDNNTSGLSVGWLHLFILAIAIPACVALWQINRRAESLLVAALITMAVLLLLMQLDPANGIWQTLHVLDVLQFRVRLLNTFGLIAAICAGYVFIVLPQRFRWAIPVLIAGFIVLQLPSLYPRLQHRYTNFPERPTIADAQAWAFANKTPGLTLTTSKELIPIWREMEFFGDQEVQQIAASPLAELPDKATILETERRMDYLHFRIVTAADFSAKVHVMYFPGWVGYVNGKPVPLTPITPTGYTGMVIPYGDNVIELRYEGTPAQHVGDVITLVALLVLIAISVLWRKSEERAHRNMPLHATPYFVGVVAIIGLAAVKAIWVDSATTLFRTSSTCEALSIARKQVLVQFGDNIQLCGFTFNTRTLHPGDTVEVTLYWQLRDKETLPTYSFVHFVGTSFNPATNNPLWGQQDKQTPGTLPTTLWVPGKLYVDHYQFKIPDNTPPHEKADYQLQVGWINSSGQRLKLEIISGDVRLSEFTSLVLADVEVH